VANVSGSLLIGPTADRPAASADLAGFIYVDTDTNTVLRCSGAAWVTVSGGGGGSPSMQDIYPWFIPAMQLLAWPNGTIGFVNSGTMGTGSKWGWVVEAPKAGNIHKIHWRLGTVSTATDVDCRIETVDAATGLNTGTLWGTNTNGTFPAPYSSGAWATVTLTADATVAYRDRLAVVLVPTGSPSFNISSDLGIASGTFLGFPYKLSGTSGTMSAAAPNGPIVLALEYSDGSFAYMPGTNPVKTVTNTTFNSGSSPDEIGLYFKFPTKVRVGGFYCIIDLDADCDVVLYDSNGTSVLETVTLDKDLRGSTSATLRFQRFASGYELVANTFYRLAYKPGASNVTVPDLGYDSAAMLNQLSPGSDWVYTSRTDGGAWSQINTRRPVMGLMVDQVQIP
jgi:hypothetical protein